jgi:hypothetical protein
MRTVFWVMMRSLVGRYQRFGGSYRLHLQGTCTYRLVVMVFLWMCADFCLCKLTIW